MSAKIVKADLSYRTKRHKILHPQGSKALRVFIIPWENRLLLFPYFGITIGTSEKGEKSYVT